MTKAPIHLSRPTAVAESLHDQATDTTGFINKKVLLTGDADILALYNGRECFINSLLLLARITPNLFVSLPEGSLLYSEVTKLVNYLSLPNKVEFISVPNFKDYQAILFVGHDAKEHLPWTTINSNGWLARISSMGKPISDICQNANPIGALAAASLGVSEIFKRLIALKPERGQFFDKLSFSFFNYEITNQAGPEIPANLSIDFMLVGVGAIGNGIVHLLQSLQISGTLLVIDKEDFKEENLGTCLLVGSGDVNRPKINLAKRLLDGKFKINVNKGLISELLPRFGKEFPFPKLVVTALDNVDARREVQRLWPDLIIDGAIGELGCQVTLHPWDKNLSCLMCDYEKQPIRAEEIQSNSTGLRESRLDDPESEISEEDVAFAPDDKKNWLRNRIGKKICSVVSEATIEQISHEKQAAGFRPSVPFVACLSACMVTAELTRHAMKEKELLETGFQFDSLIGPHFGKPMAHSRKFTCMCTQRKDVIQALRQKRNPE